MSRVQMLRALVNERLTAAVEDIFGVFKRTIAEYEEEVSRSKKEISRQRELLDTILNPKIQLNRTDPQQLFVCKEEQQEWSPSLGQEEPEPPHIKEEQEEFIQGLEKAEVATLALLQENSENNEEKQLLQLNPTQTEENREAEPLASISTEELKTEPDGEDCGMSEPDINLGPASDLESTSDGQLFSSDCSETETADSDNDWKETREPQSSLNTLKSKKTQRVEGQSVSVSNKFRRSVEWSNELKPSSQIPSAVGCKVCWKSFPSKTSLMRHGLIHESDCGLCGKHLEPEERIKHHLKTHSTCNVCCKRFCYISELEQHMQVHTRQKPFSCTVCKKGFGRKNSLKEHMRLHTGEKRFSCSICSKRFGHKGNLNKHMRLHTGEKPYSCSVCSRTFNERGNLNIHMRLHTGERPYTCSDCGKNFNQQTHLKSHKCVIITTVDEAVGGGEQSF